MTLSETINKMIQTILESSEFTSANPTHINRLIQINTLENPDLEKEVEKIVQENQEGDIRDNIDFKKNEKQVRETSEEIKRFKDGNIGEIQDMAATQFGNIKSFAANPTGFIVGNVFRKLAKGAGVLTLAILFFEVVKFIIDELLKPGRLLDRRFKRDISEEIIKFRQREEKKKIAQGYSRIIITSMPRLRGGQSQVRDTFRDIASGKPVFVNEASEFHNPVATTATLSSKGGFGSKHGRRGGR